MFVQPSLSVADPSNHGPIPGPPAAAGAPRHKTHEDHPYGRQARPA